jgi:hypothetical protein
MAIRLKAGTTTIALDHRQLTMRTVLQRKRAPWPPTAKTVRRQVHHTFAFRHPPLPELAETLEGIIRRRLRRRSARTMSWAASESPPFTMVRGLLSNEVQLCGHHRGTPSSRSPLTDALPVISFVLFFPRSRERALPRRDRRVPSGVPERLHQAGTGFGGPGSRGDDLEVGGQVPEGRPQRTRQVERAR